MSNQNNNQLSQEQNYQVLLDALKYTSDIVVTLTEKNTINENKITVLENKISYLEKVLFEQKNLLSKNNQMTEDLVNKISHLEKNIITSINKDTLLVKNNEKSNVDLEFLSQSINELNQLKDRLTQNNLSVSNEELDLETINNTLCNATLLSDVTSFNLEDIEKFKKQKTASSLVENLIKRKQELESKITGLQSGFTNQTQSQSINNITNLSSGISTNKSNPSIIIEDENQKELKENKNSDLNAIRRKKNFARKF